jgi:CheY-like chemotaxis protein
MNQPRDVSQPNARPNVAPKRLLVADDDTTVRASLVEVLASEGYLVDEARNGIEAVTCAIKHSPDLVLLDLNMPHWDGWTAFSQLDRVTPLVPVVVITARANQYEKAVRLGVDAFMEKPLDFPILLKAISTLLQESPNAHVKRVTNRRFVTRLLSVPGKEPPR